MIVTTVERLIKGARSDPVFDEVYRKNSLRRAVAETLFRLRKTANLTQEALGKKAKWAQSYVARLERGEANSVSAMEGIERYANACGASVVLVLVDPKTNIVQGALALGEEPSMKEFATKLEYLASHAVLRQILQNLDQNMKTMSEQFARATVQFSRPSFIESVEISPSEQPPARESTRRQRSKE